jgi:hypothetical protein
MKVDSILAPVVAVCHQPELLASHRMEGMGDLKSNHRHHRHAVQLASLANAFCESFMKTLKYEEVHRQEYRDLLEARPAIQQFLEKVYNQRHLLSALDTFLRWNSSRRCRARPPQ